MPNSIFAKLFHKPLIVQHPFADVLEENIVSLQAAPRLIKEITKLTAATSDENTDIQFGQIKTAALLFDKKDIASVESLKGQLEKNDKVLLAAYKEFDYALTTFKSLKIFFEKDPKCKDATLLKQYSDNKAKYRRISKQMETLVQCCDTYHAFIKDAIELCAPAPEMTRADMKKIGRGLYNTSKNVIPASSFSCPSPRACPIGVMLSEKINQCVIPRRFLSGTQCL